MSQRQRQWALCSHPGRQISCPREAWIALNMFILHPKLPTQLESPVASCHMEDQLRSRPIPCECTARSPCRAPGLHTCKPCRPGHCQLWGSAAQAPSAPTVSSAQAGVRLERKCSLLSSPEKDQGAGQGSESMHRHPPKQGFSPQKAKELLSSP